MSAGQVQSSRGAVVGLREMALALSALAAAIVVSILICQLFIAAIAAGGHKRPLLSGSGDICRAPDPPARAAIFSPRRAKP